ncbi:SixA phosphatase family protein [Candidatus Marinarcus aquaticus]|nr:histidine phosphatase family protein [Candidatus Marinarcus aquaticus]
MLELFLIRHAKSSWKDLTLDDFERPLNKRGKYSALFMSEKLLKKAAIPDMILCSPAKRAKATSKPFCKTLKVSNIHFDPLIYEASMHDLYTMIKQISPSHKKVFLIGHNPELNALAYELVQHQENIPTCGIVHIQFHTQLWENVTQECAKKVNFYFPKQYNDFFDYF